MNAYFKQTPDGDTDRKEEYMNREINHKMSLVGRKKPNLLCIALVVFCLFAYFNSQAAAQSSHSLAQYQTPIKNQLGRDTCWAFAGVAALEAAYNRQYGIVLDLSEQYAFHMPKAMELHTMLPNRSWVHDNNTSLRGFEGSSNIVELLSRYAVPEESFAPYLSNDQMKQLQAKLKVGDIVNHPSKIGFDTFEFNEEHIPMAARWNARYRVTHYSRVLNPRSTSLLEQVLLGNYELVADFKLRWKLNPLTNVYEFDPSIKDANSHIMLIIGYDQVAQVFILKNSWGENDYIRVSYDFVRNAIGGAYYILTVANPFTIQKKARYLGCWDFDQVYNGVRLKGRLVIRRFAPINSITQDAPAKLGSLYPEDGSAPLDVIGYFTDDGDGVVFDVHHPQETMHFNYPLGFWRVVDSNYTGQFEIGTLDQPFRSLTAAADSIHPGGVVVVLPGSHMGIGTYNKPMTIRTFYGPATLGNGN